MRLLSVLASLIFVFRSCADLRAQTYEKLWQFENGSTPRAGLVQSNDGNFYGTTYAGGNHGMGSVFKLTSAGIITTLASFNGPNGSNVYAPLALGADGNLYGTTSGGGAYAKGTLFKVTPQGALTTLVDFNGDNGANPYAGLTPYSDGSLYGTTTSGDHNGDYNGGTVFKVTPQGALTTLHGFASYNEGTSPFGALCLHPDGNFYGATYNGGSGGDGGTLFKMTPSGALTTLISFNGPNGKDPYGKLALGADGALYGATAHGGASTGDGFLFKTTTAGASTPLVSFNSINGSTPYAGLCAHPNGNFYGTTTFGGGNNQRGTIYGITPAGKLTTYLQFSGAFGSFPYGELILGSDGNFYGTVSEGTTGGAGGVFKLTPGGGVTNFASFRGYGGGPLTQVTGTEGLGSKLILGSDGNFYGTTYLGGASNQGTVFKVTPAGVVTTLASFSAAAGTGAYPVGALVQGDDGAFYGTTSDGTTSGTTVGYGTIFRVTAAGVLTKLFNFHGDNGNTPCGGLVRGADGYLYGTTFYGGPSPYGLTSGAGTIFKISLTGALTTLVQLGDATGLRPYASLTLGRDGNFYGSTTGYPTAPSTIFKLTPAGTLTIIYTFNSATGDKPCGALVEASPGVFYGTTYAGGTAPGAGGTIFRVTSTGQFSNVFNFDSTAIANGYNPHAELTLGPDGNLYSVASRGGASDSGTLFRITPGGVLTTLFSFDGTNQGYCPVQTPVFGSDGNLYGTANSVVYRFKLAAVPLTPVQSWRQRYFGTTDNTGNAADNADPDGDGIPNLVEYALDLDPTKSSMTGLPAVGQSGNFLMLTAAKNTAASDLTYSAEASSDLINWNSAGVTILVNSANSFQARDNIAISASVPHRFLRLRVTHP